MFLFLIASTINPIALLLATFAAFLFRLLPLFVIRNASLSKTRETFGRVFLVSFIDCCIQFDDGAAAVVDDSDGAAAVIVDGDDPAAAVVDDGDGGTPCDDGNCDAVVSARAIASCKRVLIAFLNSTSSNCKSEYRVLT